MRRCLLSCFAAFAIGCASTPQTLPAPVEEVVQGIELPEIDIPYTEFVLSNGLRVVVHEDRKAPVVAVNVWYHVGSKNEVQGRTGFAHLFEHLMFQGSENYKGEYFEPLEKIGATDLNGTTNRDRTNYFQTVPSHALDVALFMESDRMGHFAGAITQKLLDEQREVVKNEKRQNYLNRPYGRVWMLASELSYPVGHPYSWTTIGKMADLDAATLDDVKAWFGTYYGASNAVVVLAGDISPDEARAKVEKYFGHIPAGPSIDRPGPRIAPMTSHSRYAYPDKVSEPRIHRIYNVPQWGTDELEHLRLASFVLGSGKSSRLHKRLVYEEQLATSASAYVMDGEMGSQMWVVASVKPGADTDRVEAIIDEELQWFLADGPTQDELNRARTKFVASAVSRLERVGGFGGKSDILAQSTVYGNRPDAYKTSLNVFKSATTEDVQRTAMQWLQDGSLTLNVLPEKTFSTTTAAVDRSQLPVPTELPALALPSIERAKLSNGIEVVLMSRPESPVVNLRLLFGGGFTADQNAIPGTMNLLTSLLDEGTATRDAMTIAQQLEDLGASIGAGSSLDQSSVTLQAMPSVLEPALAILTDMVQQPAFPENELARVRQLTLAGIQREKTQPATMGQRLLGPLLFGENHPYGLPLTGSGYEQGVPNITRDTLVELHKKTFVPANTRILATGGIKMDALIALLEPTFGSWENTQVAPITNVPDVQPRTNVEFVIIDKPGAAQSFIFAANIIGRANELDLATTQLANDVIGGSFTARINMNLREDKGWSYGARTFVLTTLGPQVFGVSTGVQSDKTAESIAEINRELREYLTTRPATQDELSRAQANRTLKLPGQNETSQALMGSLNEIVTFGYPDDHFQRYVESVRSRTPQDITALASSIVKPDAMLWVIVGDRAKIEDKIKALGLGSVRVETLAD